MSGNSPFLSNVKPSIKGGSSSIILPPQKEGSSSTAKASQKEGRLSFEEIDRRRRKLGVSVERLLGEARVSRFAWRELKKDAARTRGTTLERFERGLARLAAGERAADDGARIMLYRTTVGIIASELGYDVAYAQALACDFSGEKPENAEWLAAARVRRLAIYTLTTAFGQKNADVARAAGCSRQNVGKAISDIEALRDLDKVIDHLLTRCARLVKP